MDMERVRREKFCENNGKVLRAVNMLRTKYVKCREMEYGLAPDITSADMADCINYLHESGYIHLRDIEYHNEVRDLADAELNKLEAKLTAKGIQFLNGKISDDCIRR